MVTRNEEGEGEGGEKEGVGGGGGGGGGEEKKGGGKKGDEKKRRGKWLAITKPLITIGAL